MMATFSGSGRGNAGFSVQLIGLKEVSARLSRIEAGYRKEGNREIRDEAGKIAEKTVIPALKSAAAQAPNARFAMRFAAVLKVKRDRAVAVWTPSKTPNLSGLKRGVGDKKATGKYGMATNTKTRAKAQRLATTKNYATTLAWGSEFGPYSGSKVNRYGVPRNPHGYWVQPGADRVMPQVRRDWLVAVNRVLIKWGADR